MSSPRRVRNAVALATIAILSGCSDVVAPVVTKIQQVAARVDNLLTCTNSWVSATSGNWETASNWSAGHAPTSTEDACITLEGNYTVYVIGAQVKSLTLSAPGNVDKPTLQLYGFTNGPGWPPTDGNLYVTNNIDNYGTIIMTNAGAPNPGGAAITIISTTGKWFNHAGSALYVRAGTGPGRQINAGIVNDGDVGFDISTVVTTGAFVNNAHFVVGPAANVEMHYVDFTQNSDRFENNGGFSVTGAGFTINGGTMSGNAPALNGGHLTIGDPTVATTLNIAGGETLDGNVGPNQVLNVNGYMQAGWPPFDASVQWNSGLQNAGVIRMQSLGGPGEAGVTLSAPNNGIIVNTGRIETLGAIANARTIAANIDNRPEGTVDLKTYTTFVGASGTSSNAGIWKLESTMNIMGPMTFVQAGGTLDATGGWQQVWGSSFFEMGGGTILGQPWLSGATVRIPAASTATGSLLFTGEVKLVGDVKTGQTLTVAGFNQGPGWPPVNGQITIGANVTNHGKIVMTSFGDSPGSTILQMGTGATLTNASDGRVDILTGTGSPSRIIYGNVTNDGTLHNEVMTLFSSGTVYSSGHVDGGGELRMWYGTTSFFSGAMQANILNAGTFHIGQAVGAPGALAVDGWVYFYDGNVNLDIGGTVPGTDFDRMTVTGAATLGTTLNVAAVGGKCAGGGQSYEVISAASRTGDFGLKNGLNLGGGRTVTTVPGNTNYLLSVSGPPCVPPDITPPVIAPTVTGTLGANGWYTSDVTVTWSVTDAESVVSAQSGCGSTTLTSDNASVTYTCSATSAGGSATQSVTVKRDATPPVVTATRAPAANANGWNNTDVSASWTATDAMSGVAGSASAADVFALEGKNQGGAHTFTDNAGNTASASVAGINIDKTAPVVTATRAPAANANGWNNTSVTASWTATDALSGVSGNATDSQLFDSDCNNSGASRTFTDLAGNSATAGVTGISIDKTAPVVTVTRLPLPGPDGWNETDVTVTYAAADALSGISGAPTFTQVFTIGANQSGSHTFTDLAGNSTTGSITGINIRAVTPPPPPPPMDVSCSASPSSIWPPNGKMVPVRITISGPVKRYTLRAAFSDEWWQDRNHWRNGDRDDDHDRRAKGKDDDRDDNGGWDRRHDRDDDNWNEERDRSHGRNERDERDIQGFRVGSADVTGAVRADRMSKGDGRVYYFVYQLVLTDGTQKKCVATVVVPHDLGKSK